MFAERFGAPTVDTRGRQDMKSVLLGVAAIAALAGAASAHTTYLDPFGVGGDVDPFFLNQGFNHLDLVAAEMFNDNGTFEFDIVANADIAATNWGKFLVFIDTVPGGRTDNPWGRNVTTTNGADFYIGGWADGGGGAEVYQVIGGNWQLIGATYNPGPQPLSVDLANASAGVYHINLDESILGVTGGQSIFLDFVTTAGGTTDPGVDHLSLGTIATPNWSTGSVSGDFLKYEVEPTPGSIAVLGLAGLMAGRRRRA